MRLCLRLGVVSAMLVAAALGLIALRSGTNQAGHRLHSLFGEKRRLEKTCCRIELSIAGLKNQERLREQAANLRAHEPAEDILTDGPAAAGGSGRSGRPQGRPTSGPP